MTARRWLATFASVVLATAALACAPSRTPLESPPRAALSNDAFLDTLEVRTFRFFWDLAHPVTRLTPDRWPTQSFASVSATGFALAAYGIGAERGYVSRDAAAARTLESMQFLWNARQDTTASGAAGYRGFFYHFLEPETGHRFRDVELSTMDTALLLAGALFAQSYFDGPSDVERRIRAVADSLYRRADWTWASCRPPTIGHGWTPEGGFLPYDWGGYNEAMILYLLALGSPSHPVSPAAWGAWTKGYRWGTFGAGTFHGQEHVGFAPLFGHHYTHLWIDFRGIQDDVMRARGIDYFENARRAVLAQHAYAVANPHGWSGYGPLLWGLTACDGPVEAALELGGKTRQFHTYWARGASFTEIQDDGTICPSAAAGSIAFAPEIVLPTLQSLQTTYGENIFSTYGFLDALNPTFTSGVAVQHGRVTEQGWFDTDYLGIDQGPILAMVENHRSGLVWRVLSRNPHVVRGLRAAGFRGGWLDDAPVEP